MKRNEERTEELPDVLAPPYVELGTCSTGRAKAGQERASCRGRRSSPRAACRSGSPSLPVSASVGGTAPPTGSGQVGQAADLPPRGATVNRGSWAGSRSRSTGWSCTTGFVARDTETRKLVVLTAGRAASAATASGALVASWRGDRPGRGRGLPSGLERRRWRDRPDGCTCEQCGVWLKQTDIRSVMAWASDASQTVGSEVCRSGATSGWRCGSIVAADVDATLGGTPIHPAWWTDFRRPPAIALADPRPGWARRRHRDRDDADAIRLLDRRLDLHRAARSSLPYASLRLNQCPDQLFQCPSP